MSAISEVRALLAQRRQWFIAGLILAAAGLLVATVVAWYSALSAVIIGLLTVVVAGVLIELRRTRKTLARLRRQRRNADTAIKSMARNYAPRDETASRLDNVEEFQTSLAISLYAHRGCAALAGWELPVELVPAVARVLLQRGEPLTAHRLLATSDNVRCLPPPELRALRRHLKRRGYLGWAAMVAQVCAEITDEVADREEHRLIEGQVKVLSGEVNPVVTGAAVLQPVAGRVLHLVGRALRDEQCGYTVRTHYTALAQRDAGLEPIVVTQLGVGSDEREAAAEVELDGIAYYRLIGPRRGRIPMDDWLRQHVDRVAQLVRELRPAVLHAASDFVNALTAQVVGRHFDLPVVYESRGFWEESWLSRQAAMFGWDLHDLAAEHGLPDAYRWRRAIEDRCRRSVDHVVTLAEVMADRIEAGGVSRDQISVVPNGVDADKFPVLTRDQQLAARLGISPNTLVIGYVSSLGEYEGIDTLLSAYELIRPNSPVPVRLLIVGDGRERERLAEQAATLRSDVIFTGQVPHGAVLDYYSLIDIFVVPRKPAEVCQLVTPLKPFEAFATGRTVVFSDVRALAAIAAESRAAELFEAGSELSLASVLLSLINDPARRAKLAATGAAWVRAERSWTANGAAYRAIYERLGAVSVPVVHS